MGMVVDLEGNGGYLTLKLCETFVEVVDRSLANGFHRRNLKQILK